MGSTIFTRLAAEVVETPSGLGVILKDETFERNLYPHTPRWSCRAVGRMETVLTYLFQSAAECEGGAFRPQSGSITAEAYLDRWKRTLQTARIIPSRLMIVDHKMGSWNWDDDERKTRPIGLEPCPLDASQKQDWDAGKTLILDLSEDFDSLTWLIQTRRLSVYKAMDGSPDFSHPEIDVSEAVFQPRKTKTPTPVALPRFVHLFEGSEDLHEVQEDGLLVNRGWAYSAVGSYVAGYVQTEISDPGWYRKRISDYRKQTDAAQILPQSDRVEVVVPHGLAGYAKESTEKLAAKYAGGIKLSDVTDRGDRYQLANARCLRVTFEQRVSDSLAA